MSRRYQYPKFLCESEECWEHRTYSEKYDNFYCEAHDHYFEQDCGCSPKNCPYPKRPEKPSMMEDFGKGGI